MYRKVFVVFVFIVFFTGGPVFADDDDAPAQTVIFLVDRSGSIGELPKPENTQAVIQHTIKVAALSSQPAQFAVIIFNGDGVVVLAGDDDQPTVAYDTLLNRLQSEWPEAKGGTPLVDALQICLQMIGEAPSGEQVTVVHCGDGKPMSGILSPDKFPAVKKHMDEMIQAIVNGPYPEPIKQRQHENLRLAWGDLRTPEGERIWAIQETAELDVCFEHASALKSHGVRFLTVDFNDVEELRQLHDAAGGTDDDYLLVQPATELVNQLHGVGLTRFSGVVTPDPIVVPPDLTSFESETEVPLDAVGQAAVITVFFDEAIERFGEHVILTIESSEGNYEFSVNSQNPQTILSFDNAGRVTMATLTLPALPQDYRLTVRFESPSMSLHPSGMTIYRHLRLQEGLFAVLRPTNVSVDDSPPYSVAPTQAIRWTASLQNADNPKPEPITSVEAVLRRRSDGNEFRLTFQEDTNAPGVFITPSESRLEPGIYSAQLFFVLPSGVPCRMELNRHVESMISDEHLTLELNDTSKSLKYIDLGEVGDDAIEGTVQMFIRSLNIDYSLPVRVEIVELTDQTGIPLNAEVIVPVTDKLVVRPGQPTSLTLRWRLPERLDTIEDGPITGRLIFQRQDTEEPIDVRSHLDPEQATVTPINEIRFFLRRPTISVSAPRAFRDSIRKSNGENLLILYADVSIPFERTVRLSVGHDSVLDRELTVAWQLPFRDPEGRSHRDLLLTPDDGEATRILGPGDKDAWCYDLAIPEGYSGSTVEAMLTISGDGLRSVDIPVEIRLREPLIGHKLRAALLVLGILFAMLAVVYAVRSLHFRRYAPNREFEIDLDTPFEFASLTSSRSGGPELCFEGRDITLRRPGDYKSQRAPRRLPLDLSGQPDEELIIAKGGEGDEPGLTFSIHRVRIEDDRPIAEASIVEPGEYSKPLIAYPRRFRRSLFVCTLCVVLTITFFTPPVVSGAQWVLDLVGFH
jgi:hypothetical protein